MVRFHAGAVAREDRPLYRKALPYRPFGPRYDE